MRRGPVGTGSYLVGGHGSCSRPQDTEVWFLVSFFPLVPLSCWRVTAVPLSGDATPDTLEVTVHSRSRMSVGKVLWRMGKATGVGVLAVLPLAFAVWRLGVPWATPLLAAVCRSVVAPGVLAKLGAAMEMGLVFAGAALPILVLAHLDKRMLRIPVSAILRRPK